MLVMNWHSTMVPVKTGFIPLSFPCTMQKLNNICIYPFQDVAFKPEEFYVKTRKCEPDASSDVVEMCERYV